MLLVKNIKKVSLVTLLTLPALVAASCDPPTYGSNSQMNQIAVGTCRCSNQAISNCSIFFQRF